MKKKVKKKARVVVKAAPKVEFKRGDKIVYNGTCWNGSWCMDAWYIYESKMDGVVCAFFVGYDDPKPPVLLRRNGCVKVAEFQNQ